MGHDEVVTTYVLVPSPLLGAASWQPVASALRRAGEEAVVVGLHDVRSPADVVAAVAAAGRGLGDVVLVPHSNAGYYAPLLALHLGARACVHVDAALPGTSGGTTTLAPPGLLDRLRTLADGTGLLPVWSGWWSPGDLAAVLPDDEVWAPVAAAQPRLPLAYFTSEVAVPPHWADRPNAYLAFGDTYADEVALARGLGWPVVRLDGGHLHLLHAPDVVAATVVRLARGLGITA